MKLSLRTLLIDLLICSMSFSLQEHTDITRGVQCDDFQVISGSYVGVVLIHDFL